MVPPKMPTGEPQRQMIFDDKANDQIDNGMGIFRFGIGNFCCIYREVFLTLTAIVRGVFQVNIDGAPRVEVSEKMKDARINSVPGGLSFTNRAAVFFLVRETFLIFVFGRSFGSVIPSVGLRN